MRVTSLPSLQSCRIIMFVNTWFVGTIHLLQKQSPVSFTLDWKLTCASLLNPPVHCPWVLQLIQPGHTAKGKLFMARLQKATCAKRWTSGPLTFFVDFMPVNNCTGAPAQTQGYLKATVTAHVPRPAKLLIHVWRWLSCRCDPSPWYSSGVGGAWNISGSQVIKHTFNHFHSFTARLYSDSATFWGLIAHLSEQYLLLCHYPAMLLKTSPDRSLPPRQRCPLIGLGSSRADYELCSHWPAKCSETQLSPGIPGRKVKVWSHCLARNNRFCVFFFIPV